MGMWLPAGCRKMDIPYCIVKSKSRLGALVHQKTATALALTSVRSEDRHEFSQLVTAIRQQYNENAKAIERSWGGGTKKSCRSTPLRRPSPHARAALPGVWSCATTARVVAFSPASSSGTHQTTLWTEIQS